MLGEGLKAPECWSNKSKPIHTEPTSRSYLAKKAKGGHPLVLEMTTASSIAHALFLSFVLRAAGLRGNCISLLDLGEERKGQFPPTPTVDFTTY